MSQANNEQNALAVQTILNSFSTMAGITVGSQVKNAMSSPEFREAIKNSGTDIINSKEFRGMFLDIGKSLISEVLRNEELRDLLVTLLSQGVTRITQNETAGDFLSNILEITVSQISDAFLTETKDLKETINPQQIKIIIAETFDKEIFPSLISRIKNEVIPEASTLLRDMLSSSIKEAGRELLVPLQELIVQGIQGALINVQPEITTTHSIKLTEKFPEQQE